MLQKFLESEHQKCQKKKKDASIPYVIKAKKQSTILSTFKDAKPFGKLSPEYKKLFRKLTVFIASTNTPYSIVENEEFRSLMEAAEPRFQLPGRAVVMKEVICLVEEVKSVIQGYLHHACKIHLCTDIWSKKGLSSSYLGITAHFFSSKDNACHHILLSMKRMPHPHSGENIRNLVMKCLEEWDISPQAINVVVTDNGSNVVKAFRNDCHHASNTTNVNESQQDIEESDDDLSSEDGEFRDENNEEEIMDLSNREDDFDICEEDHTIAFQSYFKRISCFAHTLQLVVNKFNSCSRVISRTKSLIKKVNKSSKATEKLIEYGSVKLVSFCPTRWSSFFLAIDRILSIKVHLEKVLQEMELDNLRLSDWKTLQSIHQLLKPFAKYTALIRGENYTTISTVIPVIMEINMHIQEMKKNQDLATASNTLEREMKKRFGRYLDVSADDFEPLFLAATFLDPRYKLLLNSSQVAASQMFVLDQIHDAEAMSPSHVSAPIESIEKDLEEEPAMASKRFCYITKLIEERASGRETQVHPGEAELSHYVNALDFKDLDPIQFWLQEQKIYPHLSKVAINILIIPGSSTPVERIFSAAGNATAGKRNCLADENLELEVFLRNNKIYITYI